MANCVATPILVRGDQAHREAVRRDVQMLHRIRRSPHRGIPVAKLPYIAHRALRPIAKDDGYIRNRWRRRKSKGRLWLDIYRNSKGGIRDFVTRVRVLLMQRDDIRSRRLINVRRVDIIRSVELSARRIAKIPKEGNPTQRSIVEHGGIRSTTRRRGDKLRLGRGRYP